MSDRSWDLAAVHALLRDTDDDEERRRLLNRVDVLTSIVRPDVLRRTADHDDPAVDVAQDVPVTYAVLAPADGPDLRRCLASLPSGSARLVVDTSASTAGPTADHLGPATDDVQVTRFEWCDDFAAARNHAVDVIGRGWVVFVDVDEVLMPTCAARLPLILQHLSAHPGSHALAASLRVWDGGTGKPARIGRILRADGDVRYRGAVHEELVRTASAPIVVDLDCDVLHTGYRGVAGEDRLLRNLAILDRVIAEGDGRAKDHFYRARDGERLRDPAEVESDLLAAIAAPDEHIAFQGDPRGAALQRLVQAALDAGDTERAEELIAQGSDHLGGRRSSALSSLVARHELESAATRLRSAAASALLVVTEPVEVSRHLDALAMTSLVLGDVDTLQHIVNGELGGTEPPHLARLLSALDARPIP
ncbi:hypothetical protein [Nocardioides hwasunensis]|uniref:Glycosyltransferase n=1 Tax=Nocardioides hwasunensis TaxID=397258 RepID=A0ABR8MGR7_9ACTN|nr:hypothetical protein [Nocardioides hwasunensis]MBD3915158.1 hypothetical protein [Nocardioides hwasunensis]